jgi:hypothetical protein
MRKILATAVMLAFCAGCSSDELPPDAYAAPPVSKLALNVASIDIVDHSEFQPSDSPYYAYHFEPTIAQAIRKWVADNLRAAGTSGQAIIVIEDASLSARAMPTSDELMDKWFKRQQASRYTGHVNVHMELRSGQSFGFADAQADHYSTLPEQPTATERQNAYTGLLDELMRDFSKSFETSIQEHAHWAVISAP